MIFFFNFFLVRKELSHRLFVVEGKKSVTVREEQLKKATERIWIWWRKRKKAD